MVQFHHFYILWVIKLNNILIEDFFLTRGIENITNDMFLIKDLRLTSKEIIDLVIFIKMNYKVTIPIKEDMSIGDIKEKINESL